MIILPPPPKDDEEAMVQAIVAGVALVGLAVAVVVAAVFS